MSAPITPDPFVAPPNPSAKKNTNVIFIIVGVCLLGGCAVIAIFAAILFPVFSQAKLAAQRTASLKQVKTIATAINMYAADFDDAFPPMAQWETALTIRGASPLIFQPPKGAQSYALNANLPRLIYEVDRPADTPLIFESTLSGPNAVGSETNAFIRDKRLITGLVNASARAVPEAEVPSLVWGLQGSPQR